MVVQDHFDDKLCSKNGQNCTGTPILLSLIFFVLNPALVLLDALVILSSKASIWDFRLPISASRLTNFLASLESLFHLHLSCLLVRRASNSMEWVAKSPSGCLASVCGSLCGSQVAPIKGTPEGDICGGLCHLWAWASPALHA